MGWRTRLEYIYAAPRAVHSTSLLTFASHPSLWMAYKQQYVDSHSGPSTPMRITRVQARRQSRKCIYFSTSVMAAQSRHLHIMGASSEPYQGHNPRRFPERDCTRSKSCARDGGWQADRVPHVPLAAACGPVQSPSRSSSKHLAVMTNRPAHDAACLRTMLHVCFARQKES
jgi:hypothetical protein